MRTEDYEIFKVPEHSYTTSFFIGNGKKSIQLEFVFWNINFLLKANRVDRTRIIFYTKGKGYFS